MQRGKICCTRCRYEVNSHKLPLTLLRHEWKEIIHLFLMLLNVRRKQVSRQFLRNTQSKLMIEGVIILW